MDFLIIDDDKTFRDATCFLIEEAGHYAEGVDSGQLGLNWLKEDKWDAVLLDVNLGNENGLDVLVEMQKQFPDIPVVMFTAQGSVKTAVEAMRRGAVDFLEKPFQREQFMTVLARLQRFHQMSQRIERLEQEATEIKAQSLEPIFDFTTPAMREVMEVLLRAAKTPASILILGESGTGKSVAARAVHQQSHLADKPFVTVSCPSLSKELLESELFGHVEVRSLAQSKIIGAKSRPPRAEHCFSTKSAICPWKSSRNSCACFRNANTNGSAKTSRKQPISASSLPRIAI